MRCDNCGRDLQDEEITLSMNLERVHTNPECEVYSTELVYRSGRSRWCLDCVDEHNI